MKTYNIRDKVVLLDSDLAILLDEKTQNINRFRSRNAEHFFENCFNLTPNEWIAVIGKESTSKRNKKFNPWAYTLDGCLLLLSKMKQSGLIKHKEKGFEADVIKALELESWSLVGRQERLHGIQPDLILKKGTDYLIAEVQCGTLDRYHLYKSLEYRDLFEIKHKVKPRVVVFCEATLPHYDQIAAIH